MILKYKFSKMKNKKYITTDKHPELKEGIILKWGSDQPAGLYSQNGMYIESPIDSGLENGYIKEVQYPEFTKDEMIDFGEHMQGQDAYACDCLAFWIKQRK